MSNFNIIAGINQIILEKMQTGRIPWQRQWKGSGLPEVATNAVTKRAYAGINFFLLNMDLQPLQSPYFATFNQIKGLNGKIKRGSKAQPIVFWKMFDKKQPEDKDEEQTPIPVLKQYLVFNLDCVDLPEEKQAQFRPKPQLKINPSQAEQAKINRVNNFLEQIQDKPLIEYQGNEAFYMPGRDLVRVPAKEQFENLDAFYQTLFHELGHSTGHQKRLNRREVSQKAKFGSLDYSKEELVAELTSSYLASFCGTECNFDNSAAYLRSWSQQIKDDPFFFITACGKAQKAYEYLSNQHSPSQGKINN